MCDVVFDAAAEAATTVGEDGGGSADRPKQAGALHAFLDDGSAACLHDAGAGKQAVPAEAWKAHARGVALKVSGAAGRISGGFVVFRAQVLAGEMPDPDRAIAEQRPSACRVLLQPGRQATVRSRSPNCPAVS
jgi:hypothetical protein